MKRLLLLTVCAATSLLLGGCAANEVMVKRQTEAEAKIEHLFQISGGIEARLNELYGRLATADEKAADYARQILELKESVRELKENSLALQVKLQNSPVSATPKVELVNPDAAVKGREAGPPAGYVKAFGLYSSNNFAAAVQAFELFIKEQPGSDYAPNAHYWIGECYYSTSDLPRAMEFFQKVVSGWPSHAKTPDALLKLGYCHAALKQAEKAKEAFEKIIRSYPGSPAALKAREKLMSN